MTGKTIRRSVGAMVIVTATTFGWAAAAEAGATFPAVVERILMNQTDGRVSKLSLEKKRALVVCVNQILTNMPNGMKRFVLAASNFDEAEDRFGKVVLQNRAEWKQKIAQGCSHIVV